MTRGLVFVLLICIVGAFVMPQGLQGHDDENWPFRLGASGKPTEPLLRRYESLSKMKPGIRRYNMFWNSFETTRSSAKPVQCPAGSELIPASQSELDLSGFHRFHCYSTKQLHMSDLIFSMDREIGAQNAAILYSAPDFYRHPNCTGFVFGKDRIRGGCIPMPSAMDDYEDYVNMLTERYSFDSAANKLSHLVVWNEVASAGWMDCSPFIPNRAGTNGSDPLTDQQFDYWVSAYAELMNRTARAVARQGARAAARSTSSAVSTYDGVTIYASTDHCWGRPKQHQGQPLHVGTQPFLDRLWTKLGVHSFPWSLAVHPYDNGNPTQNAFPAAYTFRTLDRVAAYMVRNAAPMGSVHGLCAWALCSSHLRCMSLPPSVATLVNHVVQVAKAEANGATDEQSQAFSQLYASEQGWPYPNCCANRIRGRNICYAHMLSTATPQVDSRLCSRLLLLLPLPPFPLPLPPFPLPLPPFPLPLPPFPLPLPVFACLCSCLLLVHRLSG
jgi:hypothetical protein